MNAHNIILLFDGESVPAETNVTVEMTQSLDAVTPLPGSDLDDGWQHYRPAMLDWSVSHDGFVTAESIELIDTLVEDSGNSITIDVLLDEDYALEGDVSLSEVSITAEVGSFAKLSTKCITSDFPIIAEI